MRWLPILLIALQASAGTITENVPAPGDPSQTYTLFVPSGYDAAKKVPLLLIFDPRGRGTQAVEVFRDAAETYGWILVSSNGTRSDESWEPNERAMRALWPVAQKLGDPRRLYATGFSGTCLAAWLLGIRTGGLAGTIAVGGRLLDEAPPKQFSFANYSFAGGRDFNHREMRAIDAILERENKPHRFRSFDGVHQWPPPELARDAFAWFELLAMKEQKRPRDDAFIGAQYARDLASAKTLRDYRALLRTYDGLRAVNELRATVSHLEADPAEQRRIADEARWDAFEEQYIRDVFGNSGAIFASLRQSDAPLVPALRRAFRVADLLRRSKRGGSEGAAALRLLEALQGQLSFYFARQFDERNEVKLAEAVRALGKEIAEKTRS